MLSVAGSVALKRGKLPKREFKAFRYSSFTVPVAHKSFSIAAVTQQSLFRKSFQIQNCLLGKSIMGEEKDFVSD